MSEAGHYDASTLWLSYHWQVFWDKNSEEQFVLKNLRVTWRGLNICPWSKRQVLWGKKNKKKKREKKVTIIFWLLQSYNKNQIRIIQEHTREHFNILRRKVNGNKVSSPKIFSLLFDLSFVSTFTDQVFGGRRLSPGCLLKRLQQEWLPCGDTRTARMWLRDSGNKHSKYLLEPCSLLAEFTWIFIINSSVI